MKLTKPNSRQARKARPKTAMVRSTNITLIGWEDRGRGKKRGAEVTIIQADADDRVLESFTQHYPEVESNRARSASRNGDWRQIASRQCRRWQAKLYNRPNLCEYTSSVS